MLNAYSELESNAFACAEGIDENEIRFLLSKLDPKLPPKDVKKFLEYNHSLAQKGIIKGADSIKKMYEEIKWPRGKPDAKGKKGKKGKKRR